MGKVFELIRGTDGKVRGAHLNVLSKEDNSTYFRPIQKLIAFEIADYIPNEMIENKNNRVNEDEPGVIATEETCRSICKQPTRQAGTGQKFKV